MWCEITESNMWMGEQAAAELSLKGGLGSSEQEWGSTVHHSVYSKCDPVSHTYASCLKGTWSRQYCTVSLTPEAGAKSCVKVRQSSLR